jgi:predicted dehydrogenase
VLCEKPIVLNGAQYSELCELAHDRGLVLMEAHKTLYTPTFRAVRNVLAEHRLGRVYEVSAGFCRCEPPEIGEWRGTKEGGGALADVGVYGLAALFGLFGTEATLQAWSSHPFGKTSGEGEILLQKGELPLRVCYSFLRDGDCALRIRGEKGTLRCESFWKSRSFEIETDEGKEISEFPFESEFAFEIRRFLERIEQGETVDPYSEKISRRILEVIDALQG